MPPGCSKPAVPLSEQCRNKEILPVFSETGAFPMHCKWKNFLRFDKLLAEETLKVLSVCLPCVLVLFSFQLKWKASQGMRNGNIHNSWIICLITITFYRMLLVNRGVYHIDHLKKQYFLCCMKLKLTHNRRSAHHFAVSAPMNFVGLYYCN